ncbi:transcriptional regulator [Xenorhabdus kozodoii]|uniref:Transcriptional regulator n=1 Tax=Xenorhabdus kozodoii TaxID=351676 RepID=A0A2D0LGY0_9GAMM|nr:transcriptional regulator [Xenorhabdus kozodoii]
MDRDEDYVSIPYTKGANDDETIPHEVISIMVDEETTLQAAWRIVRLKFPLETDRFNAACFGITTARFKPDWLFSSMPPTIFRECRQIHHYSSPEYGHPTAPCLRSS